MMQESLFIEDRQAEAIQKSVDTLMNKIRPLAADTKDDLKQCEAYMRLLKDGPKTVYDIVYRCQNTELGAQTLLLLAQQAKELGELFQTAHNNLSEIAGYEREVRALEEEIESVKTLADKVKKISPTLEADFLPPLTEDNVSGVIEVDEDLLPL